MNMDSMRGHRFLRTLGVIVAVVGFVALPSAPAEATTTTTPVFTGTFTTDLPIPFACIGTCPTISFWFGPVFCLQIGTNIAKATKPILNAVGCQMFGSGTLTGSCATTWTGAGEGWYTDSLGQGYYFTFTMTKTPVAFYVAFTGTITKISTHEDGVIAGTMGLTPNSICATSSTSFAMMGSATVAIPTLP